MKILENINCSTVTFNTKDYPLVLIEDILQISAKKGEKNVIEAIQYIIFEDLHTNIGNQNSPIIFFDILYYTTIIYEDSAFNLDWA